MPFSNKSSNHSRDGPGPTHVPGGQIPPEREGSHTFQASRVTLRRAGEALILQGVLERCFTSGTCIRHPMGIRPLSPMVVQNLSHQAPKWAGGGFIISINRI